MWGAGATTDEMWGKIAGVAVRGWVNCLFCPYPDILAF